MEQLLTILAVAALFLVRIGVPVIVLIGLGLIIDHWQSKREESVRREINKHA
jgi:hypothetical protein